MRNRNKGDVDEDDMNGGDEVVEQLSTMRKELERKQEEHDAVWNGLVEV